MEVDDIKAALYTWMVRETGITVIFARQGKERPAIPYGVILFVNAGEREGMTDELRGDGDESFTMVGRRSAPVTLNIYGANANQKMCLLRDSLQRPDVVEEFSAAGISCVSDSAPLDLTELEEISYQERSQMELTLGYTVSRETDVVPIEGTDITHLNAPGGAQTFTVETP